MFKVLRVPGIIEAFVCYLSQLSHRFIGERAFGQINFNGEQSTLISEQFVALVIEVSQMAEQPLQLLDNMLDVLVIQQFQFHLYVRTESSKSSASVLSTA